jgi:cation diffusion facilitator family transporter
VTGANPTGRGDAAHEPCAAERRHEHVFGQDRRRPGERQTRIVIGLTAVTMLVEIAAGIRFGSMALLADGLHMASHAAALGISAVAYAWVRRHAADEGYSFGAGKMNALAGFAGAVLLAGFALLMAWESAERLLAPVPVDFGQAIAVAVLGLVVNAASAFVLLRGDDAPDAQDEAHQPVHHHGDSHGHGHDHNLRSAYLHVLADALTSVLAIVALLGGAYLGWRFLDPLMGIVGAAVVTRWSVGLLRESGRVLLDRQAPDRLLQKIRAAVEARAGDRVADLHVWSIAPGRWAAIVSVVSEDPLPPDGYRGLLPADLGLDHVSVEVHACRHAG